jgi:hypothetical protein
MIAPTTLAGWVEHCRQQAEAWKAEQEHWRTVTGRIGHLREEFVQGAADRIADWQALAKLTDTARLPLAVLPPDAAAEAEVPLVAAVARIAAHLPTTTDGSTR